MSPGESSSFLSWLTLRSIDGRTRRSLKQFWGWQFHLIIPPEDLASVVPELKGSKKRKLLYSCILLFYSLIIIPYGYTSSVVKHCIWGYNMDLTFLPLNILSLETMWVSLGLSSLSYEMSFYSPETTSERSTGI